MSIEIVKDGHLQGRRMRGTCTRCGCIIRCDEVDATRQDERNETLFGVKCPTPGCAEKIWMTPIEGGSKR